MCIQHDLIDRYVQGGAKLKAAVAGLDRQDLLSVPIPGTWSIQQIVLHLMDADLIWTARMKQMIAEDNPPIVGYDESRFARALCYEDQSVDDAIAIFDLNRRQFARVLARLDESALARAGMHNERGRITLGDSILAMIDHVEHHLRFVYDKRRRLGK